MLPYNGSACNEMRSNVESVAGQQRILTGTSSCGSGNAPGFGNTTTSAAGILPGAASNARRVMLGFPSANDENQQNARIQQAVNRYNGNLPPYCRSSAVYKCSLLKMKNIKPNVSQSTESENIRQSPETRYLGAGPGHLPVVFLERRPILRPIKRKSILYKLRHDTSGLPVSRFFDDTAEKYSDYKSARSVLEVLHDLSRKRISGKEEPEDASKRRQGLAGDMAPDGDVPYRPLFVSKGKSCSPKKDQTTQTLFGMADLSVTESTTNQDAKAEIRRRLAQKNNEIMASLSSSVNPSQFLVKRKRVAEVSASPAEKEKVISKKIKISASDSSYVVERPKPNTDLQVTRRNRAPRSPPTNDKLMRIYWDLPNCAENKRDVLRSMSENPGEVQFKNSLVKPVGVDSAASSLFNPTPGEHLTFSSLPSTIASTPSFSESTSSLAKSSLTDNSRNIEHLPLPITLLTTTLALFASSEAHKPVEKLNFSPGEGDTAPVPRPENRSPEESAWLNGDQRLTFRGKTLKHVDPLTADNKPLLFGSSETNPLTSSPISSKVQETANQSVTPFLPLNKNISASSPQLKLNQPISNISPSMGQPGATVSTLMVEKSISEVNASKTVPTSLPFTFSSQQSSVFAETEVKSAPLILMPVTSAKPDEQLQTSSVPSTKPPFTFGESKTDSSAFLFNSTSAAASENSASNLSQPSLLSLGNTNKFGTSATNATGVTPPFKHEELNMPEKNNPTKNAIFGPSSTSSSIKKSFVFSRLSEKDDRENISDSSEFKGSMNPTTASNLLLNETTAFSLTKPEALSSHSNVTSSDSTQTQEGKLIFTLRESAVGPSSPVPTLSLSSTDKNNLTTTMFESAKTSNAFSFGNSATNSSSQPFTFGNSQSRITVSPSGAATTSITSMPSFGQSTPSTVLFGGFANVGTNNNSASHGLAEDPSKIFPCTSAPLPTNNEVKNKLSGGFGSSISPLTSSALVPSFAIPPTSSNNPTTEPPKVGTNSLTSSVGGTSIVSPNSSFIATLAPKSTSGLTFGAASVALPSFSAAKSQENKLGTSSSINFGAAPISTSSSGFQASANSAPVFGSTTNASVFGSSSSTPAFGSTSNAPAFGSTSAVAAFGTSSNTPAFGSTSSAAAFGTSSNTPAFGSTSSAAAFGTSSNTPTFGSTSNAAPFGSSSNTPAFGSIGSTSTFGTSTNSALIFGAPGGIPSTYGGSTNNTTAFGTTTSAFGVSTISSGTPPVTTSNSTFGNSTSSSTVGTGLGFGSFPTATPPFGAPASSASTFGSASSTFGATAKTTPLFDTANKLGSASSSGPFSFGAGGSQSTSTPFNFSSAAPATSQPPALTPFAFNGSNISSSGSGASTYNFGANSASSTGSSYSFGTNPPGPTQTPTPGSSGLSTPFGSPALGPFAVPGTFSIGSGTTQPRPRSTSRLRRKP